MKIAEITNGLAAQFYYQSPERDKAVNFEQLPPERMAPFVELAKSVLINLDKMNLMVVAQSTKNAEHVEALLRDRIEAAVKDFFDGITNWKKDAIPQQELVARIFAVWKNL